LVLVFRGALNNKPLNLPARLAEALPAGRQGSAKRAGSGTPRLICLLFQLHLEFNLGMLLPEVNKRRFYDTWFRPTLLTNILLKVNRGSRV